MATPTLDQINTAMSAVDAARQADDVPDNIKIQLEQLSNVLQGIQDAVIEQSEQELADALSTSNQELQDLAQKINDMSDSLDHAASTLGKVSSTIGTIAGVIGGLL